MANSKNVKKKASEVKSWGSDDVAFVEAPNFPMVYTNNARIGFNNWDASIVFGEIVGDRDDKLLVAPRAKVTMSLAFAIELRDLLVSNIAIFEEKFGSIQRIGTTREGGGD